MILKCVICADVFRRLIPLDFFIYKPRMANTFGKEERYGIPVLFLGGVVLGCEDPVFGRAAPWGMRSFLFLNA
jgi:hypothetical protein